MLDAVDELRERIVNGEVFSLGVIAEIAGSQIPLTVVQGRFRNDPYRALLALQRASYLLHRHLDRQDDAARGSSWLG